MVVRRYILAAALLGLCLVVLGGELSPSNIGITDVPTGADFVPLGPVFELHTTRRFCQSRTYDEGEHVWGRTVIRWRGKVIWNGREIPLDATGWGEFTRFRGGPGCGCG